MEGEESSDVGGKLSNANLQLWVYVTARLT